MSQLLPYSKLHSYLCGVDRLTGEIKGFAFTQAEPKPVAGGGGATQTLEFNKVESYEHLAKALSIDAKAQARFGLFGADASFSFDKSMSINSYSIFVYAVAKVERAFTQIEDPQYKPEAAALLTSAGGDRAFREAYGDWFVRGMTMGGELMSLIEIRTTDETQRRTVDAALSGSYGVSFSGSTSLKETFDSATSGTTKHIAQHQVGGTPQKIESPDEVFAALTSFVDELSDPASQTAVPYQVGCVDYSTVPVPGAPSRVDIDQAEQSLDLLADLRTRSIRALADIQYILTNQDEFDWPADRAEAVEVLNNTSADFVDHISTLQNTASEIAKDVTKSIEGLKALKKIPSCPLPPRKAGVAKDEAPTTEETSTSTSTSPTSTDDHFKAVDTAHPEVVLTYIPGLQLLSTGNS